jgi:hypothetical protein
MRFGHSHLKVIPGGRTGSQSPPRSDGFRVISGGRASRPTSSSSLADVSCAWAEATSSAVGFYLTLSADVFDFWHSSLSGTRPSGRDGDGMRDNSQMTSVNEGRSDG